MKKLELENKFLKEFLASIRDAKKGKTIPFDVDAR